MGVIFRKSFFLAANIAAIMGLAVVASAAPKLRLSTAAVGPVVVPLGQNGQQQTIDAANVGDSSLNLSATSSVPWINVTFGVARACNLSNSCVPVNIALSASSLARGLYTGVVTLTDPNAIDAPQTFTVTIQVGSGVPDTLELFVAPGGSASASFVTGNALTTSVLNAAGGPVVTIAAPNAGSFATTFSYTINAAAGPNVNPNDYVANVSISGSQTPGDNRTLPVQVHVTTQPIASYSKSTVSFRIAQSGGKQDQFVAFSNAGQGTLTLSQVSGAPAWLTASIVGNFVKLTADATGLSPGTVTGSVTVTSNARNNSATIPVQLTVLPSGPPLVSYQGVVDNALFKLGDPVAPGGIIALFGEQLRAGDPAQAAALPLGTVLGGASVFVNDKAAPVYYVSATQINFLMPYATPAGQATVRVERDGQKSNSVSVTVANAVPRLLRIGIGDYPIAVLNDFVTFPMPTTPGIPSRPAKAGETIVFYALGLGQTNPPSADGVAAGVVQIPNSSKMILGQSSIPGSGLSINPDYAGLTPGLVGLYQINVTLPANVPRGDAVSATFDMGGGIFSNRVVVAIQ